MVSRILFFLLCFLLAAGPAASQVEIDTDANNAVDIAKGGTNATTAAGARSNLGLVIGTHVLSPGGDGSGLTGVVKSEVDPVFAGSAAYGVTLSLINNWNTCYGWGDHAAAGYLTSETGDISGVTAGTGLTGGGLTGAVSLAADTTYLQRRVAGECLSGSAIRVINADGTVSCEDDDGGAAIWGGITGLLGDQTDLAGALAAKSDIAHDHAGAYEPGLGLPAADGYVLSSTAAGVRSWVAAGSGSGDMLKSVYDTNTDNLIDDAAIAASIARDSEIPTAVSQLTNDSGYLTVPGDLDDLGDVVITTPAVGHYLTFDGTTWKNDVLPTFSGTVPDGTAANDILQWDGDEWIAHGQIDGLIDDLAGDGAINTVWSADKVFDQLAGKEPGLGLPAADGYVLSSTAAGVRSWVAAGSGSGDMLKSVYDTNTDNLIDDAAIAASIARDSEIPTAVSQLTNDSGYLTAEADPTVDTADEVIGIINTAPTTTIGAAAISADIARTADLPTVSAAAYDQLTWDGSTAVPTQDSVRDKIESMLVGGSASWGNIIGTLADQTDLATALAGKEPVLGNPSTDGYVLSSTAAGVRSWVEMSGGSVDLTAPGPIGTVTPAEGHFTVLTAQSFDWGTPPAGETGELQLLEDPANGTNSVTLKAPASISADVTWTLPAADGTSGQAWVTNGTGTLSWITPLRVSNNLSELTATAETARTNLGLTIGTNVQAYDADLDDLADGSLTGSKVATGINGSNITTGTVAATYLDASMATDAELTTHAADTTDVHGIADTAALALVSQVTAAPVAAPTTATDPCTSGRWSFDSGYVYICVATDTWMRAALASW